MGERRPTHVADHLARRMEDLAKYSPRGQLLREQERAALAAVVALVAAESDAIVALRVEELWPAPIARDTGEVVYTPPFWSAPYSRDLGTSIVCTTRG